MPKNNNSKRLGKLVATYFPRRTRLRPHVVMLNGLCVFGVFLFVRSLSIAPSTGLLLASLVLVAGSLIALVNVWRRQSRRVHLHQHGFVFEQYGESQSVLWSDINNIWQTPIYSGAGRSNEPASWTVRIQALDGRQIKLNGFDGIRAVAHRAQDVLSNRLFAIYQDAFREGSWIRFGKKLAVSNKGLTVGMKAISWFEISDIFLDDEDGIRIGHCREGAKWIHLPIGSISNFQLLAQFIGWVKSTQSLSLEEAERQVDENRSAGLFGDHATSGYADSGNDWDVNKLAASGYEWDEIDDLMTGECTMDELLARGPRQRPRVPK